jgi:hypothetical protein
MSYYHDVIGLLAASAYQAYSNALVGNPAPKISAYFERADNPQIGDFVLEISALNTDARKRLGKLLSITDELYPDWEGDEPVPTRKVWTIELLTDGAQMRWENCKFIALPLSAWTDFNFSSAIGKKMGKEG